MEAKGGGYVVVTKAKNTTQKMLISGQSLSNGKNQSLSAKVRELWHNIPEYIYAWCRKVYIIMYTK